MNRSHLATRWRIHWPQIEPTLIEYQEPVERVRVLADHRAAVGADPMPSPLQGTPTAKSITGNRDPDVPLVIAINY